LRLFLGGLFCAINLAVKRSEAAVRHTRAGSLLNGLAAEFVSLLPGVASSATQLGSRR
jgi:hypothetical protein